MKLNEKNKRIVLIGLIILSILPLVGILSFPTQLNAKSIALVASAYAGYIGMVVLLWSYILGAKSVLSVFFRDLSPVLRIHKWLGKYGSLAIFIHPLLITFSYGASWLYSFVPDTSTRFESHVTLGRLAFFVVLAVWVTSAAVRGKIKFRPWRYIHLLSYIALPFAFLHIPNVGSQFMSSMEVKAYFYGLLLVYLVFLLIRIRGFFNLDKRAYDIVEHQKIVTDTPAIWYVRMKPRNFSNRVVPEKGQYVYVKDGHISEEHPFSVLDYDETTGEIGIAYRTFGRFTQEFAKRKIGSKILLTGAYGKFTEELASSIKPKPTVFIAGGIGITPMYRHIAAKDGVEKWLFYSNRSKASAMIVPQLQSMLGARFIAAYTRERQVNQTEVQGRIDGKVIRRHLSNPSAYQFFICGSENMMNDITTELRKIGVPKRSIHAEAFSW